MHSIIGTIQTIGSFGLDLIIHKRFCLGNEFQSAYTLQVNFHNGFLQDIFQAIALPEQSHVRRWFPEQLEEYVYPAEVDDDVCIVAKTEGYV